MRKKRKKIIRKKPDLRFWEALVLSLSAAAMATACTQQRPATFADGQGENIVERSLFDAPVILRTGQQHGVGVRAGAEKGFVGVAGVEAPERIRSMFLELELAAPELSTVEIRFGLDRKYLTASKKVQSLGDLTIQEAQIAIVSRTGEVLVPVFQYEIKSYGVLQRQKNDWGEETHNLRLKETEFENATHVEVSTRKADRRLVAAPELAASEVYVASKVDRQVLSKKDLRLNLGIRVPGKDEERVLLRLDGANLNIHSILSFDSLSEGQKEAIWAQDRGGQTRADLARCSVEVAAQAGQLKDCVMVLQSQVGLTYVQAKRAQAVDGVLGFEVGFEPALAQDTGLVRITKGVEPKIVDRVNQVDQLLPSRTLFVDALRGKEFLFRRTLQDSPNGFDYAFAGLSGDLEIVKFVFDRDAVRVVRAEPLLKTPGSTSTDQETLLSLPTRYLREEKTDGQGTALAIPRLVAAEPGDKGAIAYVDWTQNRIPNTSSALNYYDLEQCFIRADEREISQVDQRLSQGQLGFTLTMNYSASPSQDCAGIYQATYFEKVQTNFSFKERISFKLYEAGNETPLLDLPYAAQKKLGFGLFTYNKKVPNPYGNTGTKETEVPLPALFDIKQGRTIDYVLAGLPEDEVLRARLIGATQEVISDWNLAFRKALEGTPLARATDVIKLRVEADQDRRELGDLDRNYIYYVQKKTHSAVIGLGGAHPNPRSGSVEAASVFIYGGNILGEVEVLKKIARAELDFAQRMTQPTPIETLVAGPKGPDPEKLTGPVLRSHAEMVQTEGRNNDQKGGFVLDQARARFSAQEFAFLKAFRSAFLEAGAHSSQEVEAAFAGRLLEAGGLPQLAREKLKAKANSSRAIARLRARLARQDLCLIDSKESAAGAGDVVAMSDLDLTVRIYKATLAHELGHNLGLRHNFAGSFDRENFKHDPSEHSGRTYSSVMDYLVDDHLTYDGLGPYDVAALRAGYAQALTLENGSALSIATVKSALGIKDWLDLTAGQGASLPVRKFRFCSDEEAGESPTCSRFDIGTTPKEIVERIASDYRSLYQFRNFRGDRVAFDWWDDGAYIGGLFSRFMPARLMLEETIYQAVTGGDGVSDWVQGAVAAMRFFHEVIRTPDAPDIAEGDERFVDVTLADGRKLAIERKWPQNLAMDDVTDTLVVRGTELDKVIAMILLTERRLGKSRYERASLRISFPEFEHLAIQDAASAMELPTVALLHDVMADQISPLAVTSLGAVELGLGFRAKTTELMRSYAAMGSAVSLDVDGLEAKDNLAAAFRVQSGFRPPSGHLAVQRPGTKSGSRTELKLWASDGAVASQSLIDRSALLGQVLKLETSLAPDFQAWIQAKMAKEGVAPEVLAELETRIDAKAKSLPDTVGLKTMEKIGPLILEMLKVAKELQTMQSQMSIHAFDLARDDVATRFENRVKADPLLAVALQSVASLGDKLGSPLLEDLVPYKPLDRQLSVVFANAELLNVFFYLLHPEYAR